MKDYLHKLYPARFNIKSKTKKQAPADRVAFMNKVLQIVLTVTEYHTQTQEQINDQGDFVPLLFQQAKISSEKQCLVKYLKSQSSISHNSQLTRIWPPEVV